MKRRNQPKASRPARPFSILAIAGVLLASACPYAAEACRCEPRPLEAYFEAATLVALAEVLGSEILPDEIRGERTVFEIRIETLYKGPPLDRLHSETSPAGCGVVAAPGDRIWVFASPRKAGIHELWIDTCSGARSAQSGFLDLAPDEVPAALGRLSPAPNNELLTELLQKIRLSKIERQRLDPSQTQALESATLIAPNQAYRAAVLARPKISRPPQVARVLIDSESDKIGLLELHGIDLSHPPNWINEKLLLVRGAFGSDTRIELVIDAEAIALVYSRFD